MSENSELNEKMTEIDETAIEAADQAEAVEAAVETENVETEAAEEAVEVEETETDEAVEAADDADSPTRLPPSPRRTWTTSCSTR